MVAIMVIAVFGCAHEGAVRATNVGTEGQAITKHKVMEYRQKQGEQVVKFSTTERVPGENFWAVVPDEVVAGKMSVANIFWHGDGCRIYADNPTNVAKGARQVTEDAIAVFRPHACSKWTWRSEDEVRLHLALVEYLSKTFGIKRFNLYGHSSGGLIAIAVATEKPPLARSVGLSAPILSVKENFWQRSQGGNVPMRAYIQYDPIDHVKRLSPEIPILVVYDLRDIYVRKEGLLDYVEKAKGLGLKIQLRLVEARPRSYHIVRRQLGEALRVPEVQKFMSSRGD
jgi:hypothetical protein